MTWITLLQRRSGRVDAIPSLPRTNPALRTLLLVLLVGSPQVEAQTPIRTWTFNAKNDANPATGTLSDTKDYDAVARAYYVNRPFVFGNGGGSSDPELVDDSAFSVVPESSETDAPSQRDGLMFGTTAPPLKDLHVYLDISFAIDSADRLRVQYAKNRYEDPVWQNFGLIVANSPGWTNGIHLDFSLVPETVSNVWFGVRFVTEWASPAGFQGPGGAPYGAGTILIDHLWFTGTVIPEPAPLSLLALGLTALLTAGRWSRRA